MSNPLTAGDRIRLKVRLLSGWKGFGIVVEQYHDLIYFVKEGDDPDDRLKWCVAGRCEVAKCRTAPKKREQSR